MVGSNDTSDVEYFVRLQEHDGCVWSLHVILGNHGGTFSVYAKDPIELFAKAHSHLLSEELRRNGGQK